MSRLSPFGFLFGKSLTDLIRGIRRHTDDEDRAEYLRSIVTECREEVRSPDLDVKTTAILKLAYLEMFGFDMTWAGFHVTEVMASPRFQQKRIGYLAAMQSFRGDSELLMLVTNLLKMDLVNQNPATVGVALSGLATIVTPLLAADVADDIMRMLSHSKPYTRQKAVLALHKVVLQYPEILDTALQRISDLLDQAQKELSDSGNVSVIAAAVSVVGELATHADSVQDFLELTPRLYAVFVSSKHNWTLIKLLKIFALFTRREPRLKSRLLPVIQDLLSTTDATSLVHESISCILRGRMVDADDFELGAYLTRRTLELCDQTDANLRYVAYGSLNALADVNPAFLPSDLVAKLLETPQYDPASRNRVLRLAKAIVNDDNFYDLVTGLVEQFTTADDLVQKADLAHAVSNLGAAANYAYVPDFQWFIGILDELIQVVSDEVLANRLLDIVIRVKDDSVRLSVSRLCTRWLESPPTSHDPRFAETAWWIVGEIPSAAVIEDPLALLQLVVYPTPQVVTSMVKIIARVPSPSMAVLDRTIGILAPLAYSFDFELQERACQFLELLRLAQSEPEKAASLLGIGLASLFTAYELTPIAAGSQARIRIPEGLDFDTPVANLASPPVLNFDSSSESEAEIEAISQQSAPQSSKSSTDSTLLEQEAEKQLYNLSRPRIPSGPQSLKLPKPTKKKVVIASDETVGDPSLDLNMLPQHKPKHTPLFNSGFRSTNSPLLEPEYTPEAQIEPVKVKHKKKKSKSKHHHHQHHQGDSSKSETPEVGNQQENSAAAVDSPAVQ